MEGIEELINEYERLKTRIVKAYITENNVRRREKLWYETLGRADRLLQDIQMFMDSCWLCKQGCDFCNVLDEKLEKRYSYNGIALEIFKKNYKPYTLKVSKSEGKRFVHFTVKENFESILKKGLLVDYNKEGSTTKSFGVGIYFYELNNETMEFIKNLEKISLVIFRLPKEHLKCIEDIEGNSHDGRGEYPQYCYYTEDIGKDYIEACITNKKELENFFSQKTDLFS